MSKTKGVGENKLILIFFAKELPKREKKAV